MINGCNVTMLIPMDSIFNNSYSLCGGHIAPFKQVDGVTFDGYSKDLRWQLVEVYFYQPERWDLISLRRSKNIEIQQELVNNVNQDLREAKN